MSLLKNLISTPGEQRELCTEAIQKVNQLLAEGRIGNFIPPFRVTGNWVNDSRGRGVCEMGESREALKDIAAALNAFVKVKENVAEEMLNEASMDAQQALSRVADNDSGSAFRGKDVTVEVNESAELAKKVVRGEIPGPGIKNRLSFWFNKMMYEKSKDAFLPSSMAAKELKKHGFSDDQIHMIRDTAAKAAYTAVNTLHKKYPEDVPEKYIAAIGSSFQVYNLFLNVGEKHHTEFMKLARQLFDSKIDKIDDKLKIQKPVKEDITPETDAGSLLKMVSRSLVVNEGADRSHWPEVEKEMLNHIKTKMNGKAWFNGGSFKYLIDVSKPHQLIANDGALVNVKGSILDTLERYADRHMVDDFANADPLYWGEWLSAKKQGVVEGSENFTITQKKDHSYPGSIQVVITDKSTGKQKVIAGDPRKIKQQIKQEFGIDYNFGQQGVAEGSDLDQQAMTVADKLTSGKNLEKLQAMRYDSTVYRELDRYFAKNNIPENIYNRVANIVFKRINRQGVIEGLAPGQAAWKKEMIEKGAVRFWRDQHGGGTVDRIVAYDKDGKVVGGFNRKGVAEGSSAQDKNIAVGDYVQTAAGVEGVVKHITPDGKKLTVWNRKRQADHRVDISKAEKIPGIARRKMAEQGVAEGSLLQSFTEMTSWGVSESSDLNDVSIKDMEDRRTAEELEVGDVVEITGNVNHHGKTGEIDSFGEGKKFVIVNLYNGGKHSFHSSDVSEADLSFEDDEDEDEDDTFYVAFHDEDEGASWIGEVSRRDDTKWREREFKGNPDYRWGTSYMGYLTPDQVMSWIHKDYSRGMEIEGPFFDSQEAVDFVNHNWGTISESADSVCKQCGMKDCKCEPGKCNCKPLPGYPKE